MVSMHDRNYALDWWKFIFTILVVCLHSGAIFPPNHFVRGYLAVDFFFTVSGFLLAASIFRAKKSPYQWLWSAYKKVFPMLLYAVLIKLALYYYKSGVGFFDFIRDNVLVIYELTLTHRIGITNYTVNLPDWYLSSYVICGFILYSIALISYNFCVNVFAPLVIVFGGTILARNYGHLDVHSVLVFGYVEAGIIRGLMGMGIGMIIYSASKHMPHINSVASMVMDFLILFIASAVFINTRHGLMDFWYYIVFFIIIASTCINSGMGIFSFIPLVISHNIQRYSLAIFLTHSILIDVDRVLLIHHYSVATYVLLSIAFGVASAHIVDFSVGFFNRAASHFFLLLKDKVVNVSNDGSQLSAK